MTLLCLPPLGAQVLPPAPRASGPIAWGASVAAPGALPSTAVRPMEGNRSPLGAALQAPGSVQRPGGQARAPVDRALAQNAQATDTCANSQAASPQIAKALGGEDLADMYRRMFDVSPPMLPEGKTDVVAPGQRLIVTGRCFGAAPGQVKVVLQTPARAPGQSAVAAAAQAPVIVPTVQQWSDGRIELLVPNDVRGVAPGPAALVVVRADGRTSPALGVSFYPLWEWGPLAAEFKVLACAEPHATAASRCDVQEQPVFKGARLQDRGGAFLARLSRHVGVQLRAIHFQDGEWPQPPDHRADGVDRFGVTLPAWTAAWVSQDADEVDVRPWTGNAVEGRPEEQGLRELFVRPLAGERRWSSTSDHVIEVPWAAPGAGRWRMYELKIMGIWPAGLGSKPGSPLANRAAARSAAADLSPPAITAPRQGTPRAGDFGTPRGLSAPQGLTGPGAADAVRLEDRATPLKTAPEGVTTQVLRSGSAGPAQAVWAGLARSQPQPIPALALPLASNDANATLRRSIENSGSVAKDLLRESRGPTVIQRCNGVDYAVRGADRSALTGPRVANLRQSHIGPGGAVVLNGQCFGAAPGRVRLIGNFPGGQLMLTTPVWRHDVVYAEIPAATGVASHPVVVQLLDAHGTLSNEMPGTWEAPPPPAPAMQSIEVDSAKVWDVEQCDLSAPADGLCQGSRRIEHFGPGDAMGLFGGRLWLSSLPASALGALHQRVDLDQAVSAFQGRDVYRLRAPSGCTVEKTFWSSGDHGPPSTFKATHPDARTAVVDWRADYCVKTGRALDFDWSCMSTYSSRKTVLSCPAGTVLP
ncbi:hypothetical protein AACH06_23860 [Ideonella sp. DXS29W]|uniref:IPT/TIG domain-containing protein n=1 Tax=Ideonella lacteola TaxID=2984193 RepID=A0ABU9BYJ7_9BURK